MGSVTGDGSRGQEDEAVSGGGDHGRDHRAGGRHGGDHGDGRGLVTGSGPQGRGQDLRLGGRRGEDVDGGSEPRGPLLRPRQVQPTAGILRPGRGRSYTRPASVYVEE